MPRAGRSRRLLRFARPAFGFATPGRRIRAYTNAQRQGARGVAATSAPVGFPDPTRMTRIPPSNLPSAYAPPTADDSARGPAADAPGLASAPGGTIAGLRTIAADGKRTRGALTAVRSEATRERLGRLRTELTRISPPPATADAARAAILAAMARANLAGWTIPALDDADVLAYQDGSRRIMLIAHAIIFNPSGAFRIVDLRSSTPVYFEAAGEGECRFVMPRDRDGAGVAGGRRRIGMR